MTRIGLVRSRPTVSAGGPAKARVAPAVAILMLALIGSALVGSSFAKTSYNNVQVSIQTTKQNQYSYTVAAYNSSGYLVASSQSQFPYLSFQIPDGTYLFTANAVHQYGSYCQYGYGCPLLSGLASNAAASTTVSEIGSGSNCSLPNGCPTSGAATSGVAVARPYPYFTPSAEYGYLLQRIQGSTVITIVTENETAADIPTSTISILAKYANGTSAPQAYVYAQVVGGYYWWNSKDLVMWAQTDSAGAATLVVPRAPVEVSVSKSVQVTPPKGTATYQTTVGGENVSITVYWQPMWVSLTGSALIIPPQSSAEITLHVYQPTYSMVPYGKAGLGATSAQATGGPAAYPAQQTTQETTTGAADSGQAQLLSQISPLPSIPIASTTGSATAGTDQPADPIWALPLVAGLAVVSVAVVGVATRLRK